MAPGGGRPTALICVEPEESLLGAVKILLKSRFHRLPVLDKANNTILYIITHRKINRFLVKNVMLLQSFQQPLMADSNDETTLRYNSTQVFWNVL